MCIVTLAWQSLPDCPLLLLSNRDEFYQRPTQPLHYWQDDAIYAGRDLQQGGTWLGVTQRGRWAVVTNIRERLDHTNPYSRGQLIVDYLTCAWSPMQFARALVDDQQRYGGFNLMVGTLQQAVYMSNRGEAPQLLPAGVYVMGNGLISHHWEKDARLRQRFVQELLPVVQRDQDMRLHLDIAWQLLDDQRTVPLHLLPVTGVEPELEQQLSAVCIAGDEYGTRCSNVLQMTSQHIQWWEKQQQGELKGTINTMHCAYHP